MKKPIVVVLCLLVLAFSFSADAKAKFRKGTIQDPIRVSALEEFLDGPYPGTPPCVAGCTLKTVPRGTVAKAYSWHKGWAIGPTKYDEPAWVAPNGAIKKWEQCGNPGGGYLPCPPKKKPAYCPPTAPPPACPPQPPPAEIGMAEEGVYPSACANTGRVPVAPSSESSKRIEASIIAGAAKVPVQEKQRPVCPPLPGKPGGLPDDPSQGQVRSIGLAR